MTMVDPLAAPGPLTAYGIPYITLSNIAWNPQANLFTVTCKTDVACLIAMDYWAQNDPSLPQPLAGSVTEGAATTNHTFTTPALPAGDHTGKVMGFSLRLDANDTTGLTLRSQQGMVQLIGSRTVPKGNAVPVKFFQFGGTPPPPAGGGTGVGSNTGNWNTYTWAQWNPKGTVYPG